MVLLRFVPNKHVQCAKLHPSIIFFEADVSPDVSIGSLKSNRVAAANKPLLSTNQVFGIFQLQYTCLSKMNTHDMFAAVINNLTT